MIDIGDINEFLDQFGKLCDKMISETDQDSLAYVINEIEEVLLNLFENMTVSKLQPLITAFAQSINAVILEAQAPRALHIYNKGFITDDNTVYHKIYPVSVFPFTGLGEDVFIHCMHFCGNGLTWKIQKYHNNSMIISYENSSMPLEIGVAPPDIDEVAHPHMSSYIKYFEVDGGVYMDRAIYRNYELPVFEFQNADGYYDKLDVYAKGKQDVGELYNDFLICYDTPIDTDGIVEV